MRQVAREIIGFKIVLALWVGMDYEREKDQPGSLNEN
jgi:hypothetical protein